MHQTEDYLAKAKAADEAADRAVSPIAKNCWRRIAETYRQMALGELSAATYKGRMSPS